MHETAFATKSAPSNAAYNRAEAVFARPVSLLSALVRESDKYILAELLIQAVKRRLPELDRVRMRIDLSGIDLTRVSDVTALPYGKLNLRKACAQGLDFSGADMTNAYVPEASMAGCVFQGDQTRLTRANFECANLNGAIMREVADATHMQLGGANLTGFVADNVALTRGNFHDAIVTDATFIRCEISHTNWDNMQWEAGDGRA